MGTPLTMRMGTRTGAGGHAHLIIRLTRRRIKNNDKTNDKTKYKIKNGADGHAHQCGWATGARGHAHRANNQIKKNTNNKINDKTNNKTNSPHRQVQGVLDNQHLGS